MRYKRTLAEVAKAPGTANEIAARMQREPIGVMGELKALHSEGKISRIKIKPDAGGRACYQYSVADEAQPQA